MIVVEVVGTADDTDLLAGTDLANIPTFGVLAVYAASTQNDTTITITGPGGEPVVRGQPMTLRANGEIRQEADPTYPMAATQGGHYVVAIDVVTAATFRVRAIFLEPDEL